MLPAIDLQCVVPCDSLLISPGLACVRAFRDEHYGFQLYQSDPSGNYGGWKAAAIGAGHAAANNVLKTEYKEGITLAEVCCSNGLFFIIF